MGQHRNGRIWVLLNEGRCKVFLLQRVYNDELDVCARHFTDGKQCPRVLTKVVAPDFQLLGAY